MDLSILIFIPLFAVACFSLFLVYKLGIKEKSYEEALAEQRQQTSTLLGMKPKPKEKKSKKSNKKVKEKPIQESEGDETKHGDNKENAHPIKLHVEFKEEAEEVHITEELKVPQVKEVNKKKVKKVRPILVKKEQSSQRTILEVIEAPIANHFEENPPKDDFELLRSNSKDDIFKQDQVKEKIVKDKKQTSDSTVVIKNKKNIKLQPNDTDTEKTLSSMEESKIQEKVIGVIPVAPQTNGIIVGNTGKEKKKKKSEFNTKQQLSAERDGLINSVRKAELSKTEIQLLIDLLLNKQLEAPATIDEWSEGKTDPIQKLKKQLAEKEKALADEQQALVGVQTKLREIRAEQQVEKQQLQQKIRGLEEMVQSKQIEIQALNNRYQVNAQKIQQIQTELNAEVIKTSKLMDENAALQMQAQQYEDSISQTQETDNLILKLRSELEEMSNSNQHFQQVAADKEHQNQLLNMKIANLDQGFKDSLQEQQKNLEMALRQETDYKREISNFNTTLQNQYEVGRNLEDTINKLNEQLRIANIEKAESTQLVAQLSTDLQQARDELNGLENSPDSKSKYEVEILNLSNELSSTRNDLSSRLEELQQTKNKYKAELETSNRKFLLTQKELEEQKSKNNELRTKNWKVMEALKAAENKNNNDISIDKQLKSVEKKLSLDIISKEQESQKQFMQRLFPEVKELKNHNDNDWQDKYAKHIMNYVDTLKEKQIQTSPQTSPEKTSEVAKLQTQIQHYKYIIDDTEGMLNKLQKHVEEEELKWRNQLTEKDAELERLRNNCLSQLQTKVVNLEKQLLKEEEDKKNLIEECQFLKNQKSLPSKQMDSTATIEKLSEEVDRLREQLKIEQTRNGDVGVHTKVQNCNNSSNGTSFPEHCISSSSSVASSLIGDYKKPKNKKRKKKVSHIRNSNICSNMGCQFLYCDGNSCGNNL